MLWKIVEVIDMLTEIKLRSNKHATYNFFVIVGLL